jgi:hypothetical protein
MLKDCPRNRKLETHYPITPECAGRQPAPKAKEKMNGLRCPKCELVNLLTAVSCHRCGASLVDLPATAQVSVPVEQTFQAQAFNPPIFSEFSEESETARKTFFWYRVYVGFMAALYLAVLAGGMALVFAAGTMSGDEAQQSLVMGVVYGIMGAVFALVYGIALFLPRKPYNWIVGIVLIAFGLTSCCFLPAAVPLLIFWLKPETKNYFGRT